MYNTMKTHYRPTGNGLRFLLLIIFICIRGSPALKLSKKDSTTNIYMLFYAKTKWDLDPKKTNFYS